MVTVAAPSACRAGRFRLVSGFVLVAACLAVVGPAQSAGGAASPGDGSYFISTCGYSHHAPNDPIVFPREPGFSHDHTFVGNVSTNAFSTLATLRAAGTTCSLVGDTAAYWAPTLYVDGSPVLPVGATIYYRRVTIAPVKPFPPGLHMVAGNSH